MDNDKIVIKRSPTADTRSAKEIVTKENLLQSSKMHIKDVQKAMEYMCERLIENSQNHDYTKIDNIDEFYADFHACQKDPDNVKFTDLDWFHKHITEERHHINAFCHEDVNLYDVLEMIADGVMAGIARTGEVYPLEIDSDILQRAVQNTFEDLKKQIKVEGKNE